MVRQEVVIQVGILDERFFFYSEDVDWCKRIYDVGWKLVYFPEAEAIHFGGGSSATAPIRFKIEFLKANWQYWIKHKSSLECAMFWFVKFIGTMGRAMAWLAVYVVSANRRSVARISAEAYGRMLLWLINPRMSNK
jgi:GT2 family glycosyltransferase